MAETVELTLPDDKKPPVDKPPVDKPPAEAPPRGVDLADLVRASEPPPDVTAGLTDLKRQELAAKEKTYQTIEGQTSRDQARAEAAYKKSAGADLSAIKPWDAQQAGKDYHTDPLEAFGSLGSVFAIFASAFTHQPMENALLGSAAAMGAIKNGDDVAYDRAYTAWKDNTQLALKNHQIQHETYQDAIQLMSTNMGAGRVQMQVDAARFGDKEMLFYLEHGMDDKVRELWQARQTTSLKLAEKWVKVQEDLDLLQGRRRLTDEKVAAGMSPGQAEREAQVEMRGRGIGNAEQEFTRRWWSENPEGTTEDFTRAIKTWRESYGKGGGGSHRVPKPEEAEIIRRRDEKIAAGMDRSEAYQEATQETKRAGTVPSAKLADELTGKVDRIGYMFSTIDKIDELLKKHNAITGLGGNLTRPMESIANIFGSEQSDRRQFERYIQELQEWAPRALTDSSGRPLAAEVAKVNTVIAGLRYGDTKVNTLRAYVELRPLLDRIKNDLIKRRDGASAAPAGSEAPAKPKSNWQDAPEVQ